MNGLDTEPGRNGRILVVDDSRSVRAVFCNNLSKKYDCIDAGSYEEAIECLKAYDFDVVITDVIMPGLSGVELLRKIIETYPDTAVIMVSSVDRPQRALDALRLGAFDYLIKPCELPVLELAVERALERRRLMFDARRYKHDLEARNRELTHGKAELQRLQGQVVQSEKMAALGQIAAGIAHELNNPVAFVHGNLDMLHTTVASLVKLLKFYENAGLPAQVAAEAEELKQKLGHLDAIDDLGAILSDCREGTDRIRDIVLNLRTFSHLDEAVFKKTDIHRGLDSTVRLLSQYFNNGNIILVRDYADMPEIDAFPGQLNQVWMNLLVNAAQAIGDGRGEVRVATRQDGDHVIVTVADTGSGIARQHLGRIFDPFFTTKAVGEGTGLGLSITFGIVERHRGTITVESELGKGTAFMLRLPIVLERDAAEGETGIQVFELPQVRSEMTYETHNSYC